MPIPFELIMEQAPVSSQTRRRQRFHEWRQDLERAARLVWDTEVPVAVPVLVTITYFFDGTPVDVDNIPKPILDALKGLVFRDDSQVYDLLCRKKPSENSNFHLIRLSSKWIMAIWIKASLWRVKTS